jgi:hypothetical protein
MAALVMVYLYFFDQLVFYFPAARIHIPAGRYSGPSSDKRQAAHNLT